MEIEKTIDNIPRKLVIEASGVFLNNFIGDYLVPAGKVAHFATNKPPDGWLLCDGSEYDPDIYVDLNAAIGNHWGTGTTGKPKVPDLRNVFLMYEPTRVKTESSTTGNDTYEEDLIKEHIHTTVNMDTHQHTHDTTIDSHHIHDLNINRVWTDNLSNTWSDYENEGLLVGHNQPGRRELIEKVVAVWKEPVYHAATTRRVPKTSQRHITGSYSFNDSVKWYSSRNHLFPEASAFDSPLGSWTTNIDFNPFNEDFQQLITLTNYKPGDMENYTSETDEDVPERWDPAVLISNAEWKYTQNGIEYRVTTAPAQTKSNIGTQVTRDDYGSVISTTNMTDNGLSWTGMSHFSNENIQITDGFHSHDIVFENSYRTNSNDNLIFNNSIEPPLQSGNHEESKPINYKMLICIKY